MIYVISDTHIDGRMYSPDSEGNFRYGWQYQNPTYVSDIFRNWSAVVTAEDTVIHVGDVIGSRFKQSTLELFRPLPGYKILIKGNHDVAKDELWLTVFDEVHHQLEIDGIVYSHYPVDLKGRSCRYNIYGHLHEYPRNIRHTILRSYKKYYSFSQHIPFVLPDMGWSPVLPEKVISRCLQIYEKLSPADSNI